MRSRTNYLVLHAFVLNIDLYVRSASLILLFVLFLNNFVIPLKIRWLVSYLIGWLYAAALDFQLVFQKHKLVSKTDTTCLQL